MNIVVVSRNKDLSSRLGEIFPEGKSGIVWQKDGDRLLAYLEENYSDVVLLENPDQMGDDGNLEELLDNIKASHPDIRIILLSEPESVPAAVESLQTGVYQYAKLPVTNQELKLLIKAALKDKAKSKKADKAGSSPAKRKFKGILGISSPMQKVFEQIERAAKVEIPVLLLGDTGTGKDLVASTIHSLSKRQKQPFIPVNLGALPSELVASELFGHEKGSFSGAIDQHQGVFEKAREGTVFLDEIDSIDEKVKVSLLRLLETKNFRRLGGDRMISTDARVIAATNSDIVKLVDEEKFRRDLFYRLDVFRIQLPPLRNRREDIPIMIEEFAGIFAREFDKKIKKLSPEFMEILTNYDWPGNVRELKNVIQRAVLVCDESTLKPGHLPPRFKPTSEQSQKITFDIGTPLDEVERVMVVRALKAAGNNRTKAAELLGISRRVIYNKLKKYNLD